MIVVAVVEAVSEGEVTVMKGKKNRWKLSDFRREGRESNEMKWIGERVMEGKRD